MKPCPFCGSNDIIITIVDTEDREGTPVALTCTDCGAQGPWAYVSANLIGCTESICEITKWNEREAVQAAVNEINAGLLRAETNACNGANTYFADGAIAAYKDALQEIEEHCGVAPEKKMGEE